MTAPSFTAAEKADGAEREAKFRERVYPKWVGSGLMTQAFADRQIAIMRAIAADYRGQAEKERLL